MFYKKAILEISQNLHKNTLVVASFFIKLQVLALQLKTKTQLFSNEFWENFKLLEAGSEYCSSSNTSLSIRRVKCRRFHNEYIWTALVTTKEFLEALIKSCY